MSSTPNITAHTKAWHQREAALATALRVSEPIMLGMRRALWQHGSVLRIEVLDRTMTFARVGTTLWMTQLPQPGANPTEACVEAFPYGAPVSDDSPALAAFLTALVCEPWDGGLRIEEGYTMTLPLDDAPIARGAQITPVAAQAAVRRKAATGADA